jgi:hypothetical protein
MVRNILTILVPLLLAHQTASAKTVEGGDLALASLVTARRC